MKLVAVDSPIVVEGLVVPIIEVLSLLPSVVVVGETLFVIPRLTLSLLILIVVLLTCVVVVVLFIDVALIRLDLSVVCTVVV